MLAYLFVILAVAVRFLPHPFTFTPVAASLLFFGARGSRKMMWLPVVLLASSDLLLNKFVYAQRFEWDQFVSWVWYAAILWLGTRLRNNAGPVRLVGASLASSVSFFIFSNLAVFLCYDDLYPKTWAGLMTCYEAAVPFFRHALVGDLLFSGVMFATPTVLHALSEAFGGSDHAAPA
jgi:hypothetical protein